VTFIPNAPRETGTATTGPGRPGTMPWRLRLGRPAAAAGLLAAAVTLALPGPAGASTRAAAGPAAAGLSAASHLGMAGHRGRGPAGAAARRGGYSRQVLKLRPMPYGAVSFGRRHGRLTVRAVVLGLTPGSSHRVSLLMPGRLRVIQFGPLTANSVGQASTTLRSSYPGRLVPGSRLVIRMGTGPHGVAAEPIAVTGRLGGPGRRPRRLHAVEAGQGPLRGRATIAYSPSHHTLTVTVTAAGLTPGPHAAHIHLGSCMSQGPVKYMLGDLVANRHGRIVHAVRVISNVTSPVPAQGWYINIHQGSSATILDNGQPTIFFRPLLCADVR
jgi:hypothetical protein